MCCQWIEDGRGADRHLLGHHNTTAAAAAAAMTSASTQDLSIANTTQVTMTHSHHPPQHPHHHHQRLRCLQSISADLITQLVLQWKTSATHIPWQRWYETLSHARFCRLGLDLLDTHTRGPAGGGSESLLARYIRFVGDFPPPSRALFVYAIELWSPLLHRTSKAQVERWVSTLREHRYYRQSHLPKCGDRNDNAEPMELGRLLPLFAWVYERSLPIRTNDSVEDDEDEEEDLGVAALYTSPAQLIQLLLDQLGGETHASQKTRVVLDKLRTHLDLQQRATSSVSNAFRSDNNNSSSSSSSSSCSNSMRSDTLLAPDWDDQIRISAQLIQCVGQAAKRCVETAQADMERVHRTTSVAAAVAAAVAATDVPVGEEAGRTTIATQVYQEWLTPCIIDALSHLVTDLTFFLVLRTWTASHHPAAPGTTTMPVTGTATATATATCAWLSAHAQTLHEHFQKVVRAHRLAPPGGTLAAETYLKLRLLTNETWLIETLQAEGSGLSDLFNSLKDEESNLLQTYLAVLWSYLDGRGCTSELDGPYIKKVALQHCLSFHRGAESSWLERMHQFTLQIPTIAMANTTKFPQYAILERAWQHVCAESQGVVEDEGTVDDDRDHDTNDIQTEAEAEEEDNDNNEATAVRVAQLKARVHQVVVAIRRQPLYAHLLQGTLLLAHSMRRQQAHETTQITQTSPASTAFRHLFTETLCRVVQETIVRACPSVV